MTPVVSVVVPTWRRPELLDRCLAALLCQQIDPGTYEVIVADNDASAHTERQVDGWRERAAREGRTIRYVAANGVRGPAAARNKGWHAARGAIIAFTDDDCIPEHNWLSNGLRAFVAGVDGVSGRIIVPLDARPSDYEKNAALLEHARFLTACCFYTRDALAAAGGFDERFELAWREDTDLVLRLRACGARLVEADDVVVLHPIRPASWGVSLQQQRKSMYNALLYSKHPRQYAEVARPAVPWHYYRTLTALALGLLGLVAGRRRLAAAGLVAWLALTGQFCARRLDGTSRRLPHVLEMAVTSALIPPLAVFWRLRGALRFRVWFL